MITATKTYIHANYIKSFFTEKFIDVLQQKNLFIVDLSNKKFLPDLTLEHDNSVLEIKYNNKEKIKFNMPYDINDVCNNFLNLLSSYSINFKDCNYFPYAKKINFNNLDKKLNETHNIIFSNLMLNQIEGMSKLNLYKNIWPKDKEIFMNKLDTHLTNLKNYLASDLNFSLNFMTVKGQLNLI